MTDGHGDDLYQYPGIRMNFSSNIYAHAGMEELKRHLQRSISLIGHYPEPVPRSLEQAIARRFGIGADCVLVTNGATDAIYLIAEAFRHCDYAIGQEPTFSEYEDACRMQGMAAGPSDRAAMLWLCNPNNPTGSVLPPQEIRRLARSHAYVVVDQSYEDFTLAPVLPHSEATLTDNIIVVRSLTKTYAIPGLRVGYITAAPTVVSRLRRYVRPWSVNALAIEAGLWLMRHQVRAVPDIQAYLAETGRLRRQLDSIPGIEAFQTSTSYMLGRCDYATAAQLKSWLARHHGILIRDASNFAGLSPHHFRVSTQTPEENDLLVAAITSHRCHCQQCRSSEPPPPCR